MNLPDHSLVFTSEEMRRGARRWLLLGVAALAAAGVFAGMLANTKSVYFYTALVAHVDLSVLVWFLAFSCLLMALEVPWGVWRQAGSAGYICACLGTLLIAVSAFSGGKPYQNNYVPVIYHPLFFVALALLFCGVTFIAAQLLVNYRARTAAAPVQVGIVSIAALLLMAAFCFLWSYRGLPGHERDQTYYEYLFWAGGHVLQIAYAQLMIIAWLWLLENAGLKPYLSRRVIILCYAFGVLAGVAGLALSLAFAPGTAEHREGFTLLMKHANGLPALVAGAGIAAALWRHRPPMNLYVVSIVMSMLLFAAGGALGYMISGSNVTVPAHYHGSIVGVTIALMGLAYALLPKIGFADVYGWKLARMQPVLYGGGQLFWMAGMAIGGYQGVGRKTIDSADVIGGLGGFLKHGGDGLSLIGGLLFVYVVIRAVWKK